MKFRYTLLPILLAAAALPACDRDTADGDAGASGSAERGGPAAEYTRDLLFVPGTATPDTASGPAVLTFLARGRRGGVHRESDGWMLGGGGWTHAWDFGWEGAETRQPWRLVPHDELRLLVGMDDEIEAMVLGPDSAPRLRLEPGDFVAEWTPAPGAQILLRDGRAQRGAHSAGGWVLDARFGEVAEQDSMYDAAPEAALDSDAPADFGADEMDASTSPAPDGVAPYDIRRVVGVLAAGESMVLVLGEGPGGITLWAWEPDQEHTIDRVLLTEAEGGDAGARTFRLQNAAVATPAAGDSSAAADSSGATTPAATVVAGDLHATNAGGRGAPAWVTGRLRLGDDELDVRGLLRPSE